MKAQTYTALAALAVAIGGPAFAAGDDLTIVEPVASPMVMVDVTPDWSGFYAGAQLGYGWGSTTGASNDVDGNGYLGGLNAGYRFDFGGWAAGAELDYDFANIDADEHSDDFINAIYRVKFNAGGKAGQALIYGTAGWAWAEADLEGDTRTGDGYFYGAGVAYALNDQSFLSGELLQNDFSDFDGTGVDLEATTFTVRYDWKF